MKKLLFVTATVLTAGVVGFGFRKPVNLASAKVEQLQGLYIFTDATPDAQYDYLGSVKSTISYGGSQYTDVRDRLIRKAKEDFPQANGLILHLVSGKTDVGDAIRLHE